MVELSAKRFACFPYSKIVKKKSAFELSELEQCKWKSSTFVSSASHGVELEKYFKSFVEPICDSSRGLQVLVISMSALRCISILNQFKASKSKLKSVKLFSRHIKVCFCIFLI